MNNLKPYFGQKVQCVIIYKDQIVSRLEGILDIDEFNTISVDPGDAACGWIVIREPEKCEVDATDKRIQIEYTLNG